MTQTGAEHGSARRLPPPETVTRALPGAVGSRLAGTTRRLTLVLVPVVAAGTATVVVALWSLVTSSPSGSTLAGAAALLIAAAAAEALPVPLEGVAIGRTSLATIFIVAAAVLYDWSIATLIGACAMASVEFARRTPLVRVLYNTSVYALAAAAAGGVGELVDGSGVGVRVAATLLAALAFYLVDITLVAVVVGSADGRNPLRLLAGYVVRTVVPFAVLACLAVLLVLVWERSPFAAVVLAGPLAALVFYERRVYDALGRLRELDRLKDEFIAVVSHELRTPLASVYGASVTLQRDDLDHDTRDSLLGVIHQESARLARLVDQVLWTSRPEAPRGTHPAVTTDPAAVAEAVVAATRVQLRPGQSLELSAEPVLPPVAGDPEQVKQVLLNLVENAIKYSPDGGRIDLRLAATDGGVTFAVADEGLGIPAAEQERVFEKFHRVDPNLTRGVGGTGLGLYISRRLVEQLGGKISVASELGEGSTFTVELPRADATPDA
jgi:signal transduction histidine kinase